MNILIIGRNHHMSECQAKFGATHEYKAVDNHEHAEKILQNGDLVFDFLLDEAPGRIDIYSNKKITAFINTAKKSLGEFMLHSTQPSAATFIGFNGLPTFLNRPLLEVSLLQKSDEEIVKKACASLNTEYMLVDDRVGMVTPRIICMIINVAYLTIQDGTASRTDIDLAMKLGTNYPYGPFEWCQRIGVKHVYEILDAVYRDTRDERYKISALLKKEYLAEVTPPN
jgi:3-hydroxybutyryl-CoA dehydrogenase